MFVGKKTKLPAGDFNTYTSKCDLAKNGWALFRPDVYELKLMEYNAKAEAVEVGDKVSWADCLKGPPYPDNSKKKKVPVDKTPKSSRRLLNELTLRGLSVNPVTTGKFITLKKLKNKDESNKIKPYDDGLYFKFDKIIKPKHVSFYCKTDDKSNESCDFRLFQVNTEKTQWEDN